MESSRCKKCGKLIFTGDRCFDCKNLLNKIERKETDQMRCLTDFNECR